MSCNFPPRDQTLLFFDWLCAYYQNPGGRQNVNCIAVDNEGIAVWMQEYLRYRTEGKTHEQAIMGVQAQIDKEWGIPPAPQPQPPDPPIPGPGPTSPLNGYLRIGPNNSFADDAGPRVVRFFSLFPALALWRQNRSFVLQQLDSAAGYYHGVRFFTHLADPWQPDDLDVRPSWPDFDQTYLDFGRACLERGLRLSVSCGDLQYMPIADYHPFIRRIAGLSAQLGETAVAQTGMVNEARVNSWSEVLEDWDFWADALAQWQSIYPWGQSGLSDPGTMEEPQGLIDCSRSPATLALLHGTRQGPIDAIRRAFNVRFEGNIGKAISQDEPTNMHGPNPGRISVYQPLQTKEQVFGLYSMITLTGQLLTYFGDAALTNRMPVTSDWGFRLLPERWKEMEIPENVGGYRLIPGHRGEAPVTITGIPSSTKPDRCDNMAAPDGSRGFAVVYGGTGTWEIFRRDGGVIDVWGPDGRILSGAGKQSVEAYREAVVVSWHR